MNLNIADVVIDGAVASSQDAMALSIALRENGEDELAVHWARFAEYLVASEIYVGPPTSDMN